MKHARLGLSAAVTALGLAASAGLAGPFTAGTIVVTQVGDGSAALAIGGTAVFLVELVPATGVIVQTIPIPTVGAGAHHALVVRGTSTSSTHMSRTLDGRYLLVGGIDGPLGGATSISATPSATNPRIIARINAQGVVDTTTALSDAYSGDDIRMAVSTNGTDLWTSGTASVAATAGARYSTFGGSTSVQLGSPPTNTRTINIFNSQLYIASASTTFQGVSTVGTGVPTTSGQTITLLPGFPTATGPSPYDFYFADANTLYVADDRAAASGGGIQKWTFDAGTSTWTLAYTLNSGITVGCRGLTATTKAGTTTLWATTGEGVGAGTTNRVVTVADTGAASAFAVVATSPVNTHYRGIDFSPVAGPATCYPDCNQDHALNVNDFICFQSAFAANAPYADCDNNQQQNVNDFICFQSAFAAGCSQL